MKKLTIILFVLMLIFTLASCGGREDTTTAAPTEGDTSASSVVEEATSDTEDTTADNEATSEENTAAEIKNAVLSVEQTDDISGIGYGKVFNASTDEYAFYAVFRTDVRITDVKVLGLTFVEASEDGTITFNREELYSQDELKSEEVLCVHLTADGAIPAYGISYADTDGTIKSFSVNMSGEDGSLYLAEIR